MMGWRDLGNSRCTELEEQCQPIGSKRHHLKVFWKIGRTGQWRKPFGIWSGLSESNRHLNLGKVPYYHYTKAAQPPSFYSTPARERQAFPTHAGLEPTLQRPDRSGNLSYPRGLHNRRAALTLSEASSLIFVGVNAAELFPVGVEHADEEMVMLAAAILVKRSLASYPRFFRFSFCHVGHPIRRKFSTGLSHGGKLHTSTREDSNLRFITAEKRVNG